MGIVVERNPTINNGLANKNFDYDSIREVSNVRLNQTLQNCLEVSVGNTVYNLRKYNREKLVDTTFIEYPNTRGYLLQKWKIRCKDNDNNWKKYKGLSNQQE